MLMVSGLWCIEPGAFDHLTIHVLSPSHMDSYVILFLPAIQELQKNLSSYLKFEWSSDHQ
jgi:hypothetical protein